MLTQARVHMSEQCLAGMRKLFHALPARHGASICCPETAMFLLSLLTLHA